MAITTTTLSKAVASGDLTINVTSATGFLPDLYVSVENEWMQIAKFYVPGGLSVAVARGMDGTINGAHVTGGNVSVYGLLSDFPAFLPAQTTAVTPIAGRSRLVTSITSVTGAIPLPAPGQDLVVLLNGTTVINATLVPPTKDIDGSVVYISANGKAAHTLTIAAGVGAGGAGFTIATFSASQQMGFTLLAANGVWVLVGNGLTSATAAAGGPIWS